MINIPLASLRTPKEDGGSEVMVNANGCVSVRKDEDELFVVVDSGISKVTRATSEDSDEERESVGPSPRLLVSPLVLVASAMIVYALLVAERVV